MAEDPNVYGQEFTYGDTEWGDRLTQTSYNNIQSDSIGNLTMMEDAEAPGNYFGYVWEHGRELAVFEDYWLTGREWECTYDANGMRTKRANSIEGEYTYVYDGGLLSSMAVNNNTLYFTYDATGTPLTVTFNGTTYYYVTNVQGDVVAILDTDGNTVVTYTYDAWGNHSSYGSANSNLAFYNPLRYRGYVYDEELYMYYVASRYYDPSLGRWISADAFVSTGQGFIGNNMFAYCLNNPLNNVDILGTRCVTIVSRLSDTPEKNVMERWAEKGVRYESYNSNNGGRIWNSYLITEYSDLYEYADYLVNKSEFKNDFIGSVEGVVYEWEIHNWMYHYGPSKWEVSARDVDLGGTIFDDPHYPLNSLMWYGFYKIHPEEYMSDLISWKNR